MGKPKREDLNQFLIAHLNTIYDTLQLFDRTASPTEEKVNWSDVRQMSDHLSKQATIVGMLWTGEAPKAESLKETMESYFNALQGFLLCCHGSTVGAGPTLSSTIHSSVKQIVDSSFRLLQGSVSLYEGSYEKEKKPSIPKLSGAVWEACSNFKKVPGTNVTAIGRGITQVAVSMKDVLREMNEVKPASGDDHNEDDDDEEDDDFGDDLSPEEMEAAKMVAEIVSETITVIKELIRVITGMIKMEENPKDDSGFVDSLEKLLKLCQGTGSQIDELGACVYPPQEISKMKQAVKMIEGNLGEFEAEVERLKTSSDAFSGACRKLRGSIKHMETELDKRCEDQVVVEMQNVTLGS
uniref:Cyclin-D1-binding protein 1-like protein n=1 Tax=Noccaea caerulescens TaxID=107243 RepID=A0A1J3GB84_NOCCA